METDIVVYMLPLFVFFILFELVLDKIYGRNYYRLDDSFASIGLGVLSRTSAVIFMLLGLAVSDVLLAQWQLPPWPSDALWVWLVCYIGYDFCYYWFHRCSHEINFFWASHVVHHQSEEFNYCTALRQSSTTLFAWVFSWPLILLGAPLTVLSTCIAINLVYMFWVHTRYVGKLGWLEHLLVTPSHHRVHHAQNSLYIDKNHGGTFIIWDKLFGTFQAEEAEEPMRYGVRTPLKSYNPLAANFQIWHYLGKDAWHTKLWRDKLRIWIMPTGWRPRDVQRKFPRSKPEQNVSAKKPVRHKKLDAWIRVYLFVQLTAILLLNAYMMLSLSENIMPTLIIWSLVSLPLVTIGLTLDKGDERYEWYRVAVSFVATFSLLAYLDTFFVAVFTSYLVLSLFLLALRRLLPEADMVIRDESGGIDSL